MQVEFQNEIAEFGALTVIGKVIIEKCYRRMLRNVQGNQAKSMWVLEKLNYV